MCHPCGCPHLKVSLFSLLDCRSERNRARCGYSIARPSIRLIAGDVHKLYTVRYILRYGVGLHFSGIETSIITIGEKFKWFPFVIMITGMTNLDTYIWLMRIQNAENVKVVSCRGAHICWKVMLVLCCMSLCNRFFLLGSSFHQF